MIHSLNNVWRVAELAKLFTRVLYDSSPRRCEGRRRRSLNSPSSVLVGEFLEQRDLLSALTVTTTSDTSNDGDTSSIAALRIHPGTDGKISLREAIRAANNSEGPDTITFDPRLTSRGRVTIAPRLVDDITADNSAFAITSTLTIVGAPNSNVIKLKGTGPQGDLRLFRVLAGGNLTLQGLSFTKWATDTNGAVLAVDPQATVTIRNCVCSNNAAQSQGGAIFNLFGTVTLIDSQLTGNRAHDGGAYNGGGQTYGGMASFTNCILKGNTAVDRGGAIALYNAAVRMTDCKLAKNTAHQGGAIAGGEISLTGSTLTRNIAVHGAAIFVGIGGGASRSAIAEPGALGGTSTLSLSNCTFKNNRDKHRGNGSAYGSIDGIAMASGFDGGGFLDVYPTSFVEGVGTVPSLPPKTTISVGPDGIRYALTPQRAFLRQIPGGEWAILDDLVQNYRIAPNGDCYWLNDRHELRRIRAGTGGDLLAQLVQSFAMDQNGTVYSLSHGASSGNYVMFRSSSALLLDPPTRPSPGGGDIFCVDPPTPEFILQAASLNGPAVFNQKLVVEPLVDALNNIHDWPNIGRARVHHCHYKCTIYYSTALNGDAEAVIYIDMDYMIAAEHAQKSDDTSDSEAAHEMAAPASLSTASISTSTVADASRSDTVRALWTGPDGTIYKLGGDFNGQLIVGHPSFPLVLWRLPPGGNWEPLERVLDAAVAPDNTLFALNTNHELQRLVPGATQWTKVISDVQSFKMAEDGIIYALTSNGTLARVRRESQSNRWLASTLDAGIRSLTVSADGNVYTLNNRSELNRLSANGRRFVRIETNVLSLEQGADGAIHLLNKSSQLKQLDSKRRWRVTYSGVQSFQLDPDGVVYTLSKRHELLRSTPRGHWSTLHSDVQSFIAAPNGLRSVYVLTTHGELLRLEAGYAWRSLRTDVVAITINSLGVVTSRDRTGGIRMYWSPTTVPSLDPVDGDVFCVDPPSRERVLRAVGIADGPGVDVVIEGTEDQLDPPRWFSNLGEISANWLHHCHYRCTVNSMTAMGFRSVFIEIDNDSLIRWASPSSE